MNRHASNNILIAKKWPILVVLFLVINLSALQAANFGDYEYTDDGTSITITEYTGTGGNITLPSEICGKLVTGIEEGAFYHCIKLTSVSIPYSVSSIGDMEFYTCTGLVYFDVDSGNNTYASVDGVLFNKSITRLIKYPAAKTDSTYTIPVGVTSIGDYAFAECSGLASIIIPNSITSIGEGALWECTRLTNVTIPNSVTNIGDFAFADCSTLSSIIIPNGVATIGEGAFIRCTRLTSVSIPRSVASIRRYAFLDCCGLKSIMIPNSVTSIGEYAFRGCTALTSVCIPESVNHIKAFTFYYCTGLTSVSIPNGVTSVGASAFADCIGLNSVSIPNSVTSIGYEAFYGCRELSRIIIPTCVTSIQSNAFRNCTKLTAAFFEGRAPPTFGTGVFDTTASNFTLYYQSNALGFTSPTWKGYPATIYEPITRILY